MCAKSHIDYTYIVTYAHTSVYSHIQHIHTYFKYFQCSSGEVAYS